MGVAVSPPRGLVDAVPRRTKPAHDRAAELRLVLLTRSVRGSSHIIDRTPGAVSGRRSHAGDAGAGGVAQDRSLAPLQNAGGALPSTSHVDMNRKNDHFLFRQEQGTRAFDSTDPDTSRIWWEEVGVNQNMTFPVQPDPASGMHCWHQKVTVSPPQGGDRYGDIMVDTAQSERVYDEWMKRTRPAPGPDGTRRPLWLNRPLHPVADAYRM